LFLELSNDDEVNPDSAVRSLEDLAGELKAASDDEKLGIREALDELISEERAGPSGLPTRSEVLRFYEHFMEYTGMKTV
jgi:hypothetical protein